MKFCIGGRVPGFLILHSRGASADGVGPKLEPLAVPPSYLGSLVVVRIAHPDVA